MFKEKLNNKIAIVTGAGGKLGPIWCELLEQNGVQVFKVDLPDYDVSNMESVQSIKANCIRYYGVPHIIINNAAVDNPPGSKATFFGNWGKIINTNLGGTVKMVGVFLDDMIKNGGGNIVNIGSMLGFIASDPRNYPEGFDKPCAYGQSKAGIWNFTNNCNVRWAKKGLISTYLALSAVEGNQSKDFKRKYYDKIPIGRMLVREDFEIEFLTCCVARVPYSSPVFVDGGWCLW